MKWFSLSSRYRTYVEIFLKGFGETSVKIK